MQNRNLYDKVYENLKICFSLNFLYQGDTRLFGLKGRRLKCGTFSRKIYHFDILMTS